MPDQASIETLLAELTPAGRRKYLDMLLAENFWAFLGKVFETVAPGAQSNQRKHHRVKTRRSDGAMHLPRRAG